MRSGVVIEAGDANFNRCWRCGLVLARKDEKIGREQMKYQW